MTGTDKADGRRSRSGRVGVAAAALVAAVAAGTGGCGIGVSGGDSAGNPAAKSGPRHGNKVQLDMRRPPTPAQLGVPSGHDSVSYERRGEDMLDVDIQLPEGGRLHTPAVSYNAWFVPHVPGSAMGNQVTISRVEKDLDAGEAALLDQADSLGFNASEIRAWVAGVRRGLGNLDAPTNSVFRGRRFGYIDELSADLRVAPRQDEVLINYSVDWPVDATSTTAAAG